MKDSKVLWHVAFVSTSHTPWQPEEPRAPWLERGGEQGSWQQEVESPEPGLGQLLCYQGLHENEGNMLNHTSSRIYTPWRVFPSSPESCFLLLQVSPLPLEHYRSGELGSFRMSSNVSVCCCPSSVPRLQMWATCWCFRDWPIPWIACSCICYLCPVEIFAYLPCYVPVAFLAPHLPFSGTTET